MRIVVVLAMLGALAGCKAGDGEACAKPSDCGQGLTCFAGKCAGPQEIEAQRQAQIEARRAKEEAELRQRKLDAKLGEIREIENQINKAGDPEEVERLKRQLNEAKGGGSKGPGNARKPSCSPGDPLCSEL